MTASTHSLPVFEGRWSRRHAPVPLSTLVEEAETLLAGPMGAARPETFVQFAGFPRSGHSLIGALIGAHAAAQVAHELDAMGLVAAGFSGPRIAALARANAHAFAEAGQWWNGYRYAVGEAAGSDEDATGPEAAPRIIGDKKGDKALRRLAEDPALLARLAETFPGCRLPWIVVLRNPFDNVATMSLRKGRHYDRQRIRAEAGEAATDDAERIPDRVLPGMVADYETLCAALEGLLARVPAADVLILRHEDLVAAPRDEIARIFAFLELEAEPALVEAAARMVAPEPHRSRHEVSWPPALRARVRALTARHGFLSGYGWET